MPDRIYNLPDDSITKREMFSAMALQGLLAAQWEGSEWHPRRAELPAEAAVAFADALIAELEKDRG